MNLKNKKLLAQRTLNVGKERIVFLKSRLDEIKEAITKQDIKNLQESGAIVVREIKGRRKNLKKKAKRSKGNIRKKVNKRKQNYVILTRKLRRHLSEAKNQKKITKEELKNLRKKIRNKEFKNKNHLGEFLKSLGR
jgi:large subunit ribosomal protein L19e